MAIMVEEVPEVLVGLISYLYFTLAQNISSDLGDISALLVSRYTVTN
jgi:uncharacterized membrane protein